MNTILFHRNTEILQPLFRLIEIQKHRTLVLWTIDCSEPFLKIFEDSYPDDARPRNAVQAAILWSRGKIKMPQAKKAALDAHQAAAFVKNHLAACAAAHAMGHVVGTVHVETHAVGLVFYGLTAIVHQSIKGQQDEEVKKIIDWFYERLVYWQNQIDKVIQPWASFLLREGALNKEWILREKMNLKASK